MTGTRSVFAERRTSKTPASYHARKAIGGDRGCTLPRQCEAARLEDSEMSKYSVVSACEIRCSNLAHCQAAFGSIAAHSITQLFAIDAFPNRRDIDKPFYSLFGNLQLKLRTLRQDPAQREVLFTCRSSHVSDPTALSPMPSHAGDA